MKDDYSKEIGKFIRSTHPYSFRSGTWAQVVAVYTFRNRANYVVVFPQDAVSDLWVCEDVVANYEFKDAL